MEKEVLTRKRQSKFERRKRELMLGNNTTCKGTEGEMGYCRRSVRQKGEERAKILSKESKS